VEPCLKCGFHGAVILMAGQALNETNERVPGEDAHTCILLRSQNGHKEKIRLLAAHGMQCPLDALGIAR
jgi:hypothetical protein